MTQEKDGALPQTIQRNWMLFSALALLTAALYHRVFYFMGREWWHDPNFSHGFIVPLVAGYFVYEKMDALRNAQPRPWTPGLAVIVLGLLMLTAGFLATENFTMRVSFIVYLAGVALFFFGTGIFRHLGLPLGYLLFMVPLPYILYDAVAFPLKLFVAKYSVISLKLLGITVWREGNIIMFPNIELEVADACSGIRSLMSLIALGVAFAWVSQKTAFRKIILVAMTVPVAIFANWVRVVATGVLAKYWGAKAAEGFFHEFAGLAVFALAIGMMIGIGVLLRRGGGNE